jgi:hypothetical protein
MGEIDEKKPHNVALGFFPPTGLALLDLILG